MNKIDLIVKVVFIILGLILQVINVDRLILMTKMFESS